MLIITKIIKKIKKNNDELVFDKYTFLNLYTDINIVYSYLYDIKITSISIKKLNFYNKLVLILCSLFYSIDIYYYESDNINILSIDNSIIETIKNTKRTLIIPNLKNKNKSNFYYKLKDEILTTNWNKINTFYKSFKQIFRRLTSKYETINLDNLESVFNVYFIPLIILSKLKFISEKNSKCLIIGDNHTIENGIYISHKYTYNYPKKKKSLILFYSFTLNQYLLYNINVTSNKIIGRLLSIFKIELLDNMNLLLYDKQKIKLPTTYKPLTKDILLISKKTSKIIVKNKTIDHNFPLSTLNKFFAKHNFSKMIFLKYEYNIDKISGYKLFKVLIDKYPIINSKYYSNYDFKNIYLYNQYCKIDNTLFSIYIKNNDNKTEIIVHLSYILSSFESILINDINNILLQLTSFKDIEFTEHIINTTSSKIYWLSEFKVLFYMLFKILPKFILNIFYGNLGKLNNNGIRKQMIYKLTAEENTKILNFANKINKNIDQLFEVILLKSLTKFFKNKLVLFNDDIKYILPLEYINELNLENIFDVIDTFSKSTLCQKYIISFIFTYLNRQKFKNLYPPDFIQINKIKLDNLKKLELFKYNLKCDIACFPIQINYYIVNNEISITISSEPEYDIVKYIIPEMFKLI